MTIKVGCEWFKGPPAPADDRVAWGGSEALMNLGEGIEYWDPEERDL